MFVIGWFVAKLIRRVIVKVLNKIKLDSYVDKAGIGAPLERAGYPNSVDLIGKIIYFALMLLVIQLAVGVFGDSAISNAIDDNGRVHPEARRRDHHRHHHRRDRKCGTRTHQPGGRAPCPRATS